MPEGDAVWRACRRLHQALAGKVVTDWQVRWPTAATSDERGATTVEVVPRGKHLLHRLSSGKTLHSHLRMDGSWRVLDPAKVRRAHLADHQLRALVGARDATALGTLLGMIDLVPTEREADLVGHLGPDLLGDDWDADLAAANLRAQPEREIGAALLDQRNLAGIGTIWDAETLFAVRLDPWTPIGSLTDARVAEIVTTAHRLLHATLAFPHSCSTGILAQPTYAHGRRGRPCRRCKTPIVEGRIGEPPQDRPMFFCPRCQA